MDKLPGWFVIAVCNVHKAGRQKVVVNEGNKTKTQVIFLNSRQVYVQNQAFQRLM